MFQHCSRGIFADLIIITEYLPKDKSTTCSISRMCVKDRAVKMAEMAFFANIFLPRCSLRISLDQNQE